MKSLEVFFQFQKFFHVKFNMRINGSERPTCLCIGLFVDYFRIFKMMFVRHSRLIV